VNWGREINVRNNIFAFGKNDQISRQRSEPHISLFFEGNIVYWEEGALIKGMRDGSEYEFYGGIGGLGGSGKMLTYRNNFIIDYNLYYNPNFKNMDDITMGEGMTWQKWNERGHDTNSIYADPMFYDIKNHDFRLKSESPAFKLGFRQIDMSNVGIRKRFDFEKPVGFLPVSWREYSDKLNYIHKILNHHEKN